MDPAAALADMDELVEEFLLRSRPDDPAHLVRAALVCKRWCRIVTGAGFRRRFRELHRTAPMLGILYRHAQAQGHSVTSFTATSSFRPRGGGDLLRGWYALDSRHGRVLLAGLPLRHIPEESKLSVWDPISGERLELPEQPRHPNYVFNWDAAVLCPNGACDHLDCGRGHFLVVVVCIDYRGFFVHSYSSETGAWRDPTYGASTHWGGENLVVSNPCAYVQNALYFVFLRDMKPGILEYNPGTHEISHDLIPHYLGRGVLTTTENGGLGFAGVDGSRLNLWSREAGHDGYPIWARSRTIELDTMFPGYRSLLYSRVIGFVHGLHVFFVNTVDGIFSIDLKSGQMRKVCKERSIRKFVLYMSFCTPGTTLL
jgi:hypothetical protein